MWKRLNSNQMGETFSYKEVFLIKRFLIERFYCIYIGIYMFLLCLIKKVIISGIPSYLSTLLSEKRTGYSMRYLVQLEEARCRLQITKRSFRTFAASMWNKLPLAIRSASSISIFAKD